MKTPAKLLAIVPIAALLIGLALLLRPARIDLVVDNGLDVAIRVELQGKEMAKVSARSTVRLEDLPAGKLELAAVELDGEGRRFTLSQETASVKFSKRLTYVWNVAGATPHYWIVHYGYGDQRDKRIPPKKFTPESDLFAVPAEVKPEVDAMFPKELHVPKGTTGTVVQGLFSAHFINDGKHINPLDDPALQAALQKALEKSKQEGADSPVGPAAPKAHGPAPAGPAPAGPAPAGPAPTAGEGE